MAESLPFSHYLVTPLLVSVWLLYFIYNVSNRHNRLCSNYHRDTEEKTKSLHSMTMGKVGVILPHEITFAISILMSFVLGSASLLLFTLYAHRNYLMNTVLTFNSSDIHPLLKWIVTTRQQHSRMCIKRVSYY